MNYRTLPVKEPDVASGVKGKPCDMKGESLKNYPRCQFQYERFLMNAGCGPLMNAYRFPVEINHLCKVIAKYVDITQLIKKLVFTLVRLSMQFRTEMIS